GGVDDQRPDDPDAARTVRGMGGSARRLRRADHAHARGPDPRLRALRDIAYEPAPVPRGRPGGGAGRSQRASASGLTGYGGSSPRAIAIAFSAQRRAISERTGTVALPTWGSSTVFGSSASPGASRGSFS